MGVTKKNCPHCKEEIEIETKEKERIEIPIETNSQQLQMMQKQIDELTKPKETPKDPEPRKLKHEEIADLIPKGINVMECPGGDCGHQKLKNPKQTKKYKTCPNGDCGANTVPKNSKFCPYCTKDISEDDDLEDGIELKSDDEE